MLSQIIDGEEKVIAYGSRVLTKQERRYCVTRKELLAVVHFVKIYRHYLVGRKFVLMTDHASLRWLRSFKHPEGQVARWLEILNTYDFDLVQCMQFENKLFQEICELLGIHKTRTTPLRPQSDGKSERNIRILVKMIAMVVDIQQE